MCDGRTPRAEMFAQNQPRSQGGASHAPIQPQLWK